MIIDRIPLKKQYTNMLIYAHCCDLPLTKRTGWGIILLEREVCEMKMINGGSLYNSDRVSDDYLSINNCGYTAAMGSDMTTVRPRGRADYLILYVWHGQLRLREKNMDKTLPEGTLVVYRPWESQQYTHVAAKRTEVYWLHFSGHGVPELLRKSGLDGRTAEIGCVPEVREQFLRIIRELQLKQYQYEMYCNAYILFLLSVLSRGRMQKENAGCAQKYRRISDVIEQMNLRCQEDLSVGDLAAMCDLSEYHFIHLFREYTGVSPYAYLTRLRLERAKDLMASTTMNISEIANAVGYSNPLYFSRLFRRHVGVSPSRFREGSR